MYKKAVGYETVEEDQYIEDKNGNQIKKIHRTKKQVAPDYKALTYLLTKHFGREYYERYLELALMEKKMEKIRKNGKTQMVKWMMNKVITIMNFYKARKIKWIN